MVSFVVNSALKKYMANLFCADIFFVVQSGQFSTWLLFIIILFYLFFLLISMYMYVCIFFSLSFLCVWQRKSQPCITRRLNKLDWDTNCARDQSNRIEKEKKRKENIRRKNSHNKTHTENTLIPESWKC